jgi:hypothetical protein
MLLFLLSCGPQKGQVITATPTVAAAPAGCGLFVHIPSSVSPWASSIEYIGPVPVLPRKEGALSPEGVDGLCGLTQVEGSVRWDIAIWESGFVGEVSCTVDAESVSVQVGPTLRTSPGLLVGYMDLSSTPTNQVEGRGGIIIQFDIDDIVCPGEQ